jgi:hypothetical protein
MSDNMIALVCVLAWFIPAVVILGALHEIYGGWSDRSVIDDLPFPVLAFGWPITLVGLLLFHVTDRMGFLGRGILFLGAGPVRLVRWVQDHRDDRKARVNLAKAVVRKAGDR